MRNMDEKQQGSCPVKRSKIGGQALIEGVMMKGKDKYYIAVRREDGSISLRENYHKSIRQKSKFLFYYLKRKGVL